MSLRTRCVAVVALAATSTTALAQSTVAPHRASSSTFVATLAPNDLLAIEYFTAPYRGYYCTRVVHTDGTMEGWREVPQWARQALARASFDGVALAALNARLEALSPTPSIAPAATGSYVELTWRRPGGVVLHATYANTLPATVHAITSLVEERWARANPGLDHGCGAMP